MLTLFEYPALLVDSGLGARVCRRVRADFEKALCFLGPNGTGITLSKKLLPPDAPETRASQGIAATSAFSCKSTRVPYF